MVNNKIQEYYEEQNIVIDHNIEFNDGCASQCESINAFWLFAKRGRHTDHVYFELSHWKGPSDSLGGLIKSLASTAVCAEKLIIRDGKEWHDFLIDRYTLHNNVTMLLQEKHCVMEHQFFFIKEELDSFRNSLENNQFKTYRGTCTLHQITCHKFIKNHQLLVQKYACLSDSCNTLSMEKCEKYNALGTFCERITVNITLVK